jgi:hypothetical protein
VQINQTNNSTQFYDANHHYLMRIANYKKYQEKNSASSIRESSIHSKDDSYRKTASQVPNSAARWCSIRNIPFNLKQATRKNNAGHNRKGKKTPHADNQKEKNSNKPSQNYYYSHFYLKTKQTQAKYAVRAAKRTEEALRQIFKAIITI